MSVCLSDCHLYKRYLLTIFLTVCCVDGHSNEGRLELIRPTALEYDYVAKKLRGSMTWKYMSASGGPNSVVDIFLYWSPQPVNITWIGNNGVASWINVNEFYTGDHYDLMYSFRTPDSQSCHCLQLANGITSDSNAWNAAVGVDLLSVGVLQAESYAVVVVSRPQFMYSWGTASITLTNREQKFVT